MTNNDYTTKERALYHTNLAARRFMDIGEYEVAATIMLAGADAFQTRQMTSTQTQVTKDER